ncbi:MAG TPA: hypothetical protein VFW09_20440 [Solirubrobacteraceae bacterium]|nr:hypothetical protein [Solirubrobacteraceae bacterium]
MSVAVPDDRTRARSLRRRVLAIVDDAGLPARRHGMGWAYLAILALCLIAGAVSLRLPTTPNYDPWVWLIWGRELVHGHLSTAGGPTLKPLAMVFTTIVAPFGSAAPNMWVAIARAGIAAATTLSFLLTARLSLSAASALPRGAAIAVAGLAGIAAAGGVLLLQSFIYVAAQGYSEGLLLTVVLLAVLRHLDGAVRQTQALLFAASLDRPEMWALFIVYGLWLWRADPGARRLIGVLAALILPIWLLPDLISSGSLLRGAEYASYPRGAGTTACPFCSEVANYEWPLVRLPFRIGVALALVPAMAAAPPSRSGRARPRSERRLDVCVGVLFVAALVLFAEDAVLTELKFSGNGRYLFPAACLTIVVGMVGWARGTGWAFALAARFAGRLAAWAAAAVVAAAAVAAIVPSAVDAFAALPATWAGLRFQADVRHDVAAAIARAGGAGRLKSCGTVQTNTQLAPVVAWNLHETIGAAEATQGRVIIQGKANANARRFPWIPWIPRSLGWHVVATAGSVKIATRCHR